MQNNLSFCLVVPTQDQIKTLYELLNQRKYDISNFTKISINEHESFVKSKPYRTWYIVYKSNREIGSFYLSTANTIGINLIDSINIQTIESIIKYVKKNYKPLPEIKSFRAGKFSINVSPNNELLKKVIEELGFKSVQISYFLDKK